MRIVLAGASGFIGERLISALAARGDEVALIGRAGPDARWGDIAAITALVDGADAVINLAGKSVNCRYTARNRAEILRSRVDTTAELATAIAAAKRPPAAWLNASTATIYRHAEDRAQTESTGELGSGFSVDVATAWERALFDPALPHTRRVALRLAIVLGRGSVMPPLIRLARLGLGGAQLDGRWPATRARLAAGTYHRFAARGGSQRFSWIHIDDAVRAILFLLEQPDMNGAVNLSSPNPSDSRGVMRTLRRVLGVPFGIPAPRFVLELGAMVIRTETELVLKSRWAVPERLLEAGFTFEYPELEPALRQILRG